MQGIAHSYQSQTFIQNQKTELT